MVSSGWRTPLGQRKCVSGASNISVAATTNERSSTLYVDQVVCVAYRLLHNKLQWWMLKPFEEQYIRRSTLPINKTSSHSSITYITIIRSKALHINMRFSQILIGFTCLCLTQSLNIMQSPMSSNKGGQVEGKSILDTHVLFHRLTPHRVLPRIHERNGQHGRCFPHDGRFDRCWAIQLFYGSMPWGSDMPFW